MIPYNETAEKLGLTAYVRIENYQFTQKMAENLEAENARLKAEVERLRKAGDELHAFLINYIVDSRISSAYLNKLDDGWNAAKEGKPEEIEVGDIIYVNGTKCRVLWCDPTEYGMRLTASEDAYSKRAAKEGKPSV